MMHREDFQLSEQNAFTELIDTSREAIYRICKVYAVAPVEPQDLFQEVVFQAWRSFGTFQGKSSPATWLYRVALNVCISTKLKLNRENDQKINLDAVQFMVAEPGSDEIDEKYQALKACIATLNEASRSIIVLYLEELPYKEIAEILGLTENHVAVKMTRIRAKLFDCITQKLEQ